MLITRGKNDKVQAFHNVCSHRGNRVVNSPCGRAERHVCRHHNWAYGNADGALLGIPDQRHFFDVDKKRLGLTPVACEVWTSHARHCSPQAPRRPSRG